MKNVIFVIDSLTCGGAEKSLVTLLSLFDYEKYSVDILMFKRNGTFEKFLTDRVNIISAPKYMKLLHLPLKKSFMIKNFKYLLTRLITSFKLRLNNKSKNKLHTAQVVWKSIKSCIEPQDKKYDVAIAYSQGLPTYYVATKVNSNKKLAWINTDYNVAGYKKEYDYDFYKKYNNIVAVSDKLKEIIHKTFAEFQEKITTVYDIIDPNFLHSMSKKGKGFTDDFNGLRILTIGRIVPQKGYDLAIQACEKLKNDGYDFKWYIIGDGCIRKEIEDLIIKKNLINKFILLGEQDNPYQFLKQADIYVQTSKLEGFGLTIAEAKIFKKPLLSTDFNVIYNQIKTEYNGLIVQMNSDAIYKGIKRLIDNNNLRCYFINNLNLEKAYCTVSEVDKIYKLMENDCR